LIKLGAAKLGTLDADAGVIQARRILDRLYKEEQAAAAKMAAAE
jgi:hypothetical protein